ncbi:histidine phosphatase family protein [Sphingosinicella sp. LHD-64]|uniref:histidine phosphatase family protein n=1 Tax=Sphingosinicella sp. LHD-64 TaxID=3072139 RepID=UPI00280F848F|nr:histidine phosphatase family protein [Sphingosinicella sp. LHD-64]MDQ8758018.1 histidine phosphatase family protein [Sphingosinicella sp. LHD-64]
MRFFIARHGATVFNAAARLQGGARHTPLTRAGFAQAETMGETLRAALGPRPALDLWASPTDRALQTLAVIAEHLELDWHGARTDPRLAEIDVGDWGSRTYGEIEQLSPGFFDPAAKLFARRPPSGEWYDDIAARLTTWLDDLAGETADRLVVMHGISSCVLRGLLTGQPHRDGCGAPVAVGLAQGSVACVAGGRETVLARPNRGS